MTIARPVRLLGTLAVLLWCFFLVQIFFSPWSLGPGERYTNFERDPNLDRKSQTHDPTQVLLC